MPVYISPSLVQGGGGAADLSLARIGAFSLTLSPQYPPALLAVPGGTAPGFSLASIRSALTYERWKPNTAPATLTLVWPGRFAADYVGIAAHTIGSSGAEVVIESQSVPGAPWVEQGRAEPINDRAMMFLFPQVEAYSWRIHLSAAAEIGVLYIGKSTVMQRCLYGGHTPAVLARDAEVMTNRSIRGQFVGRSIQRFGYKTSYQWNNLDPDWYRANFDPVAAWAQLWPFFIAWHPKRWPTEVVYGWTHDDIHPVNTGVRDFMSVGFNLEAIA